MADDEDEATQAPAPLSNIIAGRAKEVLGDIVGAEDLRAEGEVQEEIAREELEHRHEHDDEGTD